MNLQLQYNYNYNNYYIPKVCIAIEIICVLGDPVNMLQSNIHILSNCCVASDLNSICIKCFVMVLVHRSLDLLKNGSASIGMDGNVSDLRDRLHPYDSAGSKYLFSGSSTSGSISGGISGGSTSRGSSGGSTSGGSSGGSSGGTSGGSSSSSSHHNDGHHSRPDNVALVPCRTDQKGYRVDEHLQQYWCQEPTRDKDGKIIDGEYNEGTNQGTIKVQGGQRTIKVRMVTIKVQKV